MAAVPQIEIKRMKLEKVKVAAARSELEFRIDERLDEINRLKDLIKVQTDKEAELAARIAEAEKAS